MLKETGIEMGRKGPFNNPFSSKEKGLGGERGKK
jgi:hypothetical protein